MNPETELHDDDKPVGRILSRREVIKLLGGAGVVLISGASLTRLTFAQTPEATETLPACIVRPELTEGPYFVDDQLNRSDIRIDPSDGSIKEGVPLHIIFRVSDVSNGCVPLEGAQIDIWSCDALGVYSGVQDSSFDTSGQLWLRGYQVTDENGRAEFITVYPGWYSGRAVHIHFKIRTDPASDSGYEFTSQFFFPEEVSDVVHAQEPYSEKGYRDVLNVDDGIYQNGGDQLVLDAMEVSAEAMATAEATAWANAEATAEAEAQVGQRSGYQAIFDIGLDLTDAEVGASDSAGGQGGGPGAGGTRPGGPRATATPGG
ncbi:MAG: intradiol ring-cleavage dioxygenase [Chitinophagaceae bacterium]|nr:intradiol ring-cleavage dioxygenase [Anaerolineae bacterium]